MTHSLSKLSLVILFSSASALCAVQPLPANSKASSHTVILGDTLGGIAKANGCHWKELMRLNNLKTDTIRVGMSLKLPATTALPSQPDVTIIEVNSKQAPAKLYKAVMARASAGNTQVIVSLAKQRAYLMVDGVIAIETPVSTGKKGHRTPSGDFSITERVEKGKTSNKYNDAPMPYWMRLGTSPVGMHIGHVPGHAASHGCIRLPAKVAPVIFALTKSGTKVTIQDQGVIPAIVPTTLFAGR